MIKCLASQDQVELLMLEKNMSLSEAIEGTKIKNLENTLGQISMIRIITYLLMRFSESFNVSKKITDGQAPIIAADIIEKYPYETVEDVILLLKQVRQGIIGDGKDYKLDGQNILNKWFPEYLDRKYAEVERLNKQAHAESIKVDTGEIHPVDRYYMEQRKKKVKQEQERKAKYQIDEMVKLMDRQMLEDTISDWERKEDMKPYLDYLKAKRREIK